MPNRQVSTQRKAQHRLGTIFVAVGMLMFLSVFVSAALHFGDFSDFEVRVRSMGLRAVGGMALMIGGFVLITLGVAGAAGAGLKLDPEQARKDLEPWARMSGGLTKDSLDEMGVDLPQIAGALTGAAAGKSSTGETLEARLRGLHALYKDGILSQAEYEREKQELLDQK